MNKKGSTLVMVITLVAIMSIFTLALFTITVADKKAVVQQDDKMQSHYIARAGIEIVAEYIISNPEAAQKFKNKTSETFSDGFDGTFQVSVETEENEDGDTIEVTLRATGSVEEKEDRVQLKLVPPNLAYAIFTNQSIELDGYWDIQDQIGSNGSITGDTHEEDGSLEKTPYMDIGLIAWGIPYLSEKNNDVEELSIPYAIGAVDELVDNTIVSFNSPSFETKLELDPDNMILLEYDVFELGKELTIDTLDPDSDPTDPEYQDLLIIINESMALKGDLTIIGEGKVIVAVRGTEETLTEVTISTPEIYGNSDPDKLWFFLDKYSMLSYQTPATLHARIIAPESLISLQAGSTIYGEITADRLIGNGGDDVTSNPTVIYVPSAYGTISYGFRRGEWNEW